MARPELWRLIPSVPGLLASSRGRIMVIPRFGDLPNGGVRQYGGSARKGSWDGARYIFVWGGKTYKVARIRRLISCVAFSASLLALSLAPIQRHVFSGSRWTINSRLGRWPNMRREFSKPVKRDALKRAAGKCENAECGAMFGVKFHFDHDIADGLGGEPTLENCKVLCHVCHAEKTTKHDIPLIAKTKRISDKHNGITRGRAKMHSQGFRKSPPQSTATRPIKKWMPA